RVDFSAPPVKGNRPENVESGMRATRKPWGEMLIGEFRPDGRELVETLEARRMLSADVALIDTSLPNFSALSAAVSDRTRVITFDGKSESAQKVLGKLIAWAAATRQQLHSVSILSHGSAGK